MKVGRLEIEVTRDNETLIRSAAVIVGSGVHRR